MDKPRNSPDAAQPTFRDGDRVRMNGFGAARFPKYRGQYATVVDGSRYPSAVRLKWNWSANSVTVNTCYIEHAEPKPPRAGDDLMPFRKSETGSTQRIPPTRIGRR